MNTAQFVGLSTGVFTFFNFYANAPYFLRPSSGIIVSSATGLACGATYSFVSKQTMKFANPRIIRPMGMLAAVGVFLLAQKIVCE